MSKNYELGELDQYLFGQGNHYEIYKKLGFCYEKLRQEARAKENYQKYLSKAPLSPETEKLKDKEDDYYYIFKKNQWEEKLAEELGYTTRPWDV